MNATGTTTFDGSKDLNVTAGVEHSKQDSNSKTNSQSVSYTYGGGGSASIGKQTSQSQNESLTHVNSEVVLNRTEGAIDKLNIQGGTVSIADRGNLQVKEIHVESLQDTASSSNSSKGGSIGGGYGSGSKNITASYNQAKGNSDSAWVNDTSKLLIGNAQNDANLDAMGVKNVTNIGGVIANATKNSDGTLTDHGKLNYSGELELKDIEDHNYNSSSGFNVSTSIGIPQKGTPEASTAPKGSTTIGVNSSGQETEQLTKATMGQGTVKNATDTTNRDINNAQEITRDQTTGMLDGSVTVDHRLLTEAGRKEIIQDHEEVANQIKDIVAATQGVIASVEFAKEYEVSTQNMTVDEKNTLDNLLQSLQVESKDNTSTWVVVAAEGVAIAGSTCARVPACVSAVVNLFGAATASAILNLGEEKKESHPKGVPSTSGNSATGMPPNGDDDKKVTKNYEKELNVSAGVARDHLRKNIPGNKAHEAHHIIPWQLRTHPLVQRASKGGFNINGAENGVRLANHRGPHQYYTKRVTDYLNHLEKTNPNMTNQQAANSLKKFTNELKTTLRKMDQPNTRLDGVK